MPERFLIAALVGLVIALNARRALRFPLLLVPAFFASWVVVETAPQLLLLTGVGAAWFISKGALDAWPGWVALPLVGLTAFVLYGITRESYRVDEVLECALEEVCGPPHARNRVTWRDWGFPFRLWTRKVRRIRDLPYVPGGRRRRRLDVWTDRSDKTGRPCFLYVPGGAWMVGISNKNQQGKPLLIEMASRGWVCFAMNYPVSPRAKFPEHIIAVKQAIAWIREHAHEYGGDPSFLMLSGNSAGGHLSSLAALTANDPDYQPGFEDADTSVQAVAPLYGIYDMTGEVLDELKPSLRRHKQSALKQFEFLVAQDRLKHGSPVFEKGSPWLRAHAEAPPFFVIHGTMDTLALVEEARAFVARLRGISKEPVIYAELPGAQHAFDTFLSIRALYTVRAISRFADWACARAKSGARNAQPQDQVLRSPTSQS